MTIEPESRRMNARVRITEGSDNVFRDLGFRESEAQNLLLRSELMSEMPKIARGTTGSRKATGRYTAAPEPAGKIDKFSIDALVNVLVHAGRRVKRRLLGPFSLWAIAYIPFVPIIKPLCLFLELEGN